MEIKQYIKETEATEASPKDVLARLKSEKFSDNMDNFLSDMNVAIEAFNKLDKWKKYLYYGKPTGFTNEEIKDSCNKLEVIDENFIRILHGSLGVATESNELLEALQKWVKNGSVDKVNLSEEIGDVMFYVGVLCNALGVDIDNILEKNNKKLKLRYPDKFDSFYAINRDLKAERDLLEN